MASNGREVRHELAPDDRILNLAYMRNAWILQRWQPSHPLSSITIQDAARAGVELEQQRASEKEAAKKNRAAQREAAKAKKAESLNKWQGKISSLGNIDWADKL